MASGIGSEEHHYEIIVQKCGIRFRPPTVYVYYQRKQTGDSSDVDYNHERVRMMPLRKFTTSSDVKEVIQALKEHHFSVLNRVSNVQLERLARIIQLNMEGYELDECLVKVKREYEIDPNEDLNKVDGDVLQRKKASMDETFKINQKKPGDTDFQYDIQVNFDDVNEMAGDQIETSGWDSDDCESLF